MTRSTGRTGTSILLAVAAAALLLCAAGCAKPEQKFLKKLQKACNAEDSETRQKLCW